MYDFQFVAPSKAWAIDHVLAQIDETAAQQPDHLKDRDAVKAAVSAFMAMTREPGEGEELAVWVNGSIKVTDDGQTEYISFHVSAYVQPAPVEEPG